MTLSYTALLSNDVYYLLHDIEYTLSNLHAIADILQTFSIKFFERKYLYDDSNFNELFSLKSNTMW